MNCCLVDAAMEGLEGLTAMDARPGTTATDNEPPIAPIFALARHFPLAFALSIPPGAMVAIVLSDELHDAVAVTSLLLPSL